MTELTKILISTFTPLLTAIIGILIKVIKDVYSERKKNKQLIELINFTMGSVDTILDDNVKMEPELRSTLRKASKKYHKLDIVKLKDTKDDE